MFTREEAIALWDDLVLDKEAFLYTFGELVMCRMRGGIPVMHPVTSHLSQEPDGFGYFIRARNRVYTQEMFAGYDRICAKHNATYRIETEGLSAGIIFFKLKTRAPQGE